MASWLLPCGCPFFYWCLTSHTVLSCDLCSLRGHSGCISSTVSLSSAFLCVAGAEVRTALIQVSCAVRTYALSVTATVHTNGVF